MYSFSLIWQSQVWLENLNISYQSCLRNENNSIYCAQSDISKMTFLWNTQVNENEQCEHNYYGVFRWFSLHSIKKLIKLFMEIYSVLQVKICLHIQFQVGFWSEYLLKSLLDKFFSDFYHNFSSVIGLWFWDQNSNTS